MFNILRRYSDVDSSQSALMLPRGVSRETAQRVLGVMRRACPGHVLVLVKLS
jgi:hypothetical protein